MSGVGKTTLARKLPSDSWYHYSGDYRIGTHYLGEQIADEFKREVSLNPKLAPLLKCNAITVRNNISIDNLAPLSAFLGKLGNPEKEGLPLKEFQRRQAAHHDSEVSAMLDVPRFIDKATYMYGFTNFLNDAGGSLCELDDLRPMQVLSKHTVLLYIRATKDDEKSLIQRAISHPKPLYYSADFLAEQLPIYMAERDIDYVALIEPNDFVRWIFPKLFYARLPKYERLAEEYGCSVSTTELEAVRDEGDFLQLVADAIDRQRSHA